MIKSIILFAFSFTIILQFGFSSDTKTADNKHGYIGTNACGMCHKNEKQGQQFGIWAKSTHAKAYKTF